jgi:hypothetical protein
MRLRTPLIAAIVAGVLLGSGRDAFAQLKGHYIPGFTGLENGSQPPPSVSVAVPIYFYPTDTIKDDDGNPFGAHPSITASFTGAALALVTNAKLFGGHVGVQVIPVAFIKSRIESASLDVPGSVAFTDIYIQPVWLGWHTTRADYTVGWGFFAPTGKWEAGSTDNAGLGMWSNDFQAGTTVHLDDAHAWTTSVLTTYEIHSTKTDSTLKAGDLLTLEGGTGKSFYKPVQGTPIPRIITVGPVYYGQFKVSADSGVGPLADVLLAGHKDRVFGIGGEASIFLPKPKLLIDVRAVPEFGARNRTQGLTFLLSLGWQVKSLVKTPSP